MRRGGEEVMRGEVRVEGWKVEDEERIGGMGLAGRAFAELLLEDDEVD